MEPLNQPTQPTPAPATPVVAAQETTHRNTKRVLIVAILVIIVGGLVWYGVYLKNKPQTALEVLEDLERSSAPVTATPAERDAQLKTLEKSSTPVEKTYEERLQELNAL